MIKKSWLLVFVCLIFGIVLPISVIHADDSDYSITKFRENINIQPNGSAIINYRVQYQFDDDMHGVYLTQALRNDKQGIQLQKVMVNQQPIGPYNGGSTGVETLRDGQNVQYKVHVPIKADDVKNVEWQYVLQDYAHRYQDIGEINAFVIGDTWDTDLNDVVITVQLPQGMQKPFGNYTHSVETAKFNGDAKVGRYTYQNNFLPAETAVELHAYFNQQTLAQAPQIAQKQLTNLKAQEKAIASRQRIAQKRTHLFQYVTFLLPIIGMAISLFAAMMYRRKRQASGANFININNFDMPSELAPAIINQQLHGYSSDAATSFSATIMDLLARKYLTVTPAVHEDMHGLRGLLTSLDKKSNQPELLLTVEKTMGLQSFELTVLEVLFDTRTDLMLGQTVSTKEFTNASSKLVKRYNKKISIFAHQVGEATNEPFIDVKANQLYKFLAITGPSLIGLGVIIELILMFGTQWGIVNWYFGVGVIGMIFLGIAMVVLNFKQQRKFIYQQDKWSKAQAWQNFGYMLKHIGDFDKKSVPDVILWDRYMGYALILGAGAEMAAALKRMQPINELTTNYLPAYMVYSALINSGTGNGFVTTSSSGSSSGGLGSGSSGGFGGGSGGGAF